jgi:hypothetical protein
MMLYISRNIQIIKFSLREKEKERDISFDSVRAERERESNI